MIVIFLGPPGGGKGTQCKQLAQRYQLRHLSSGDILRQQCHDRTPLGQQAQVFMNRGQLVPDNLVVGMVTKEIEAAAAESGVVLDGFPRTVKQAQELQNALEKIGSSVDIVLNMLVDDDKLELRVTGRRSCPKCGAAYHVTFNPPKQQDICDADDAQLLQRDDDTPELVRRRLSAYHQQTEHLVKFYQEKDNVHDIDGNESVTNVTKAITDVVDKLSLKRVV